MQKHLLLAIIILGFTIPLQADDDFAVPVNRERWNQLRKERLAWYDTVYGTLFSKTSSDPQEKMAAEVIELLIKHHDWKAYQSERNPLNEKIEVFAKQFPLSQVKHPLLRYLIMDRQIHIAKSEGRREPFSKDWINLVEQTKASTLHPYVKSYIYLRCCLMFCGEDVLPSSNQRFNNPESRKKQALQTYQHYLEILPVVLKDPNPVLRFKVGQQWQKSAAYLRSVGIKSEEWYEPVEAVLKKLPEEAELLNFIGGLHYVKAAWEARGGGVASTVSEDGYKLFKEHLNTAKEKLEKGWSLTRKNKHFALGSEIAEAMLPVGMGLGFPREEEALWFQRATSSSGGSFEACERYLLYLEPKWNGKLEDMHAFSRACYDSEFYEENLPFFMIRFNAFMTHHLRNPREFLGNEENWSLTMKYYDAMEKKYGTTTYLNTQKMLNAMYAGKEDMVRELFKKMNEQPYLAILNEGDAQFLERNYQLKIKRAINPATNTAMRTRPKAPKIDPRELVKQQVQAATHEEVKAIDFGNPDPNKERLEAGLLCVRPDGGLAITIKRSTYAERKGAVVNELHLYSATGDFEQKRSLTFKPTTMAYGPDKQLYVAGEGKLVVYSPDGKLQSEQALEHFAQLFNNAESIKEYVEKENAYRKHVKESNIRIYRDQLAKLETIPEAERTPVQKNQIRSAESMIKQLTTSTGYQELPVDQMTKELQQRVNNVYGMVIHQGRIYLGSNSPNNRGEMLWSFTMEGKDPKQVADKLPGFVNGTPWLVCDDQLVGPLANNSIGFYSFEGQLQKYWFYGASEAKPLAHLPQAFDIKLAPQKELYLLGMNGTVVSHTLDGEFKEVIFALEDKQFYSHLAISPDGKTVYILGSSKPVVRIMQRKK